MICSDSFLISLFDPMNCSYVERALLVDWRHFVGLINEVITPDLLFPRDLVVLRRRG